MLFWLIHQAVPMKILVVDDHAVTRAALRGVLKQIKPHAHVIDASDWRTAALRLRENPVTDLMLLDLNLPDRDGFEALADMRERHPEIAVVIVSEYENRDDVVKALDLGALGFIPKAAHHAVTVSAFNLIFAGSIYIPGEILQRADRSLPNNRATPPFKGSARRLELTVRQLAVLGLMMEGKSNKVICRELGVSEATVKNHATAIFKAFNVTNRTKAVITAAAMGYSAKPDE
jgi:DNA-binding NarL/FixJ family response regulator